MSNIILLLVALIVLPGCISTKRFARHVERATVATAEPMVDSVPGITILYDGPAIPDSVVQVRKGNTHLLPALVYWQIQEEFNCTLNPRLPVDMFRQVVYKKAKSLGISEKLTGGKQLVFTVHHIPANFRYLYRDDIVVLVFLVLQFYEQSIYPDESDLSVSYAIYEGERLLKEGTASELNHDPLLRNNNATRKKIMKVYMRQYRRNLSDMVEKCMVEVAHKL
ncbi:MAG: hypothetical protein KF744_11000 [Taibaiella sp.]|nr:hypothetical protein [Taibaiella sp.]